MTAESETPLGRRQRAQFERFYTDTRPHLVKALAMTLSDQGLATEAVDEAMTRAYARWSTIGEYDNPKGWVYRVAYNYAIARIRKTEREHLPGDLPDRGWRDSEPSDPMMAAAVDQLTPDLRAVVVLRYYLTWTQPEIAAVLDIPVGTVKSRIGRALSQLRGQIGKGSS